MSQKLRDYPAELLALAQLVADHFSISAVYVEKDFWVTEVLRATMSKSLVPPDTLHDRLFNPIFKGGTSLSRALRLTRRFSEDIDICLVFPPGVGKRQRHRGFVHLDSRVRWHLASDPQNVLLEGSREGVKRYTRYLYPRAERREAIREGVLLELGTRGLVQPTMTVPFRSLVADYFAEVKDPSGTRWQETEAFDVTVLAPEGTLLEKLDALHHSSVSSQAVPMARQGRHLYDIYCLLTDETVLTRMSKWGSVGIEGAAREIHRQTVSRGLPSTPRPTEGYWSSPVFQRNADMSQRLEDAYQPVGDLVYGEFPQLNDVLHAVYEVRHLL